VYSPSYVSLVWISILLIYGFATVAAAEQNMAPVSTSHHQRPLGDHNLPLWIVERARKKPADG
jgi:hypothetical protein